MQLNSLIRPIVTGIINNKNAYFLLDSGTNIPLLDITQLNLYDLTKSVKFPDSILGTGGIVEENYFCSETVTIGNYKLTGFILTDLSKICKSIFRETDLKILGIISYPLMQSMGVVVDLKNNELIGI